MARPFATYATPLARSGKASSLTRAATAYRSSPEARTTSPATDDGLEVVRDPGGHGRLGADDGHGRDTELPQQVRLRRRQPGRRPVDHEDGRPVRGGGRRRHDGVLGAVGGDDPGPRRRREGRASELRRGGHGAAAVDAVDGRGVVGGGPGDVGAEHLACPPTRTMRSGSSRSSSAAVTRGMPSGRVSSTAPPCTAAAGTAPYASDCDSPETRKTTGARAFPGKAARDAATDIAYRSSPSTRTFGGPGGRHGRPWATGRMTATGVTRRPWRRVRRWAAGPRAPGDPTA